MPSRDIKVVERDSHDLRLESGLAAEDARRIASALVSVLETEGLSYEEAADVLVLARMMFYAQPANKG